MFYNFIYFIIKFYLFFFFKQKTAYEMCGRDWSSDVCSSDLRQERSLSVYAVRHSSGESDEGCGKALVNPADAFLVQSMTPSGLKV